MRLLGPKSREQGYEQTITIFSAAVMAGSHPKNIGDEALSAAFGRALEAAGAHVNLSLGESAITNFSGLKRFNPRSPLSLLKAIRKSDAVILGGGTLLANNNSGWLGFRGLPRYCLTVALATTIARRPFMIVGVGAQQWKTLASRTAFRIVVSLADYISARDIESADYIQKNTGTRPIVTADMFFSLGQATSNANSREGVVVALGHDADKNIVDCVVDLVRDHGSVVTILRTEQSGEDDKIAQQLKVELVSAGVTVHDQSRMTDWTEALRLLSAAEVVVASRLHALILASHSATPLIVVPTSEKLTSFARAADVPLLAAGEPICAARPASTEYMKNVGASAQEDVLAVIKACTR